MVDTTDQSRVLAIEMVLSSAPVRSFEREGKWSAETLAEWCKSEPSSRFLGFSRTLLPARVGTVGYCSFTAGGAADTEYRLMRSSVLPLARMTRGGSVESGLGTGDRARDRIAEACASNKNVSTN